MGNRFLHDRSAVRWAIDGQLTAALDVTGEAPTVGGTGRVLHIWPGTHWLSVGSIGYAHREQEAGATSLQIDRWDSGAGFGWSRPFATLPLTFQADGRLELDLLQLRATDAVAGPARRTRFVPALRFDLALAWTWTDALGLVSAVAWPPDSPRWRWRRMVSPWRDWHGSSPRARSAFGGWPAKRQYPRSLFVPAAEPPRALTTYQPAMQPLSRSRNNGFIWPPQGKTWPRTSDYRMRS